MVLHSVEFVGRFPTVIICPKATKPEYAFIGRSNVGKSSLVNMLVERKDIMKVSSKPGKTSMINYLDVNKNWFLVDLPGYGYARAAKTTRAKWKKMIGDYLTKRENLQCAFVLLDSKIPLQKKDLDFMIMLAEYQVPFVIVFTKTDRMKPAEQEVAIQRIKDGILEYWTEMPESFVTSSLKREGRDEILSFIDKYNKLFYHGK